MVAMKLPDNDFVLLIGIIAGFLAIGIALSVAMGATIDWIL